MNNGIGWLAVVHTFLLKLPFVFITGLAAFFVWEDYIELKDRALKYSHKYTIARTLMEGERFFKERFALDDEKASQVILPLLLEILIEEKPLMNQFVSLTNESEKQNQQATD